MDSESAIEFFSPTVLENPFDFYASIRPTCPVLPIRQPRQDRDMFLVTSYDLVQEVLKDSATYSSKFYEILSGGAAPNPDAAAIYATGWPEIDVILTSDPPHHARFRGITSKALGPKRINAIEPLIADAIDLLIDGFITRGECDFIEEFAVPLPTYMISDLLGIDRSMVRTLAKWTDAMVLRNGQMASAEEEVEAARQIVECQHFLHDMIQQRRLQPVDDLISELISGQSPGEAPLDDIELLSILQILILGGNETTRNAMIGMMASMLGPHRDQLDLLLADPSLVRNTVEEALRLHTPVSTTWRIARRDVMLAGVAVPKGSVLMLRLDAVNHDPAQFEAPEAFDIRRENAVRHAAFGAGIHFCVGHVLARRELMLLLPRLLERLANMRIIEEKSDLRVHPMVHVRAMRGLHISFTPGTALNR